MYDEEMVPSSSEPDEEERVIEDIEPFNFLGLPRDIQLLICRQLDLNSYINLHKTSRKVRRLKLSSKTLLFPKKAQYVQMNSRRLRVAFVGECDYNYVTWEQIAPSPATIDSEVLNINLPFTDDKFRKLIQIVNQKRLKYENLVLFCEDVKNMENLWKFIDVTKPLSLTTRKPWPDEFYTDSRMKCINSLYMDDHGCGEEAFFSFNLTNIIMDGNKLTHRDLRTLFRQLYEGTRSIDKVILHYNFSFLTEPDRLDDITRGILQPIWTIDTHNQSLLKDYSISDVISFNIVQLFYLLPRKSKGLDYYHVEFDEDRIEIIKTTDMFLGVSTHLPVEVLSKVFKKCLECKKTYCEHRRKWSVARIQEGYPNVFKRFINCVSIAELVVTGLCLNSTTASTSWFLKREDHMYRTFFGFKLYYDHPYDTIIDVLEMS